MRIYNQPLTAADIQADMTRPLALELVDVRALEAAGDPAEVEHERGAVDDGLVVHRRVGGDDHRQVDALEPVVQLGVLSAERRQLGHVGIVVADRRRRGPAAAR